MTASITGIPSFAEGDPSRRRIGVAVVMALLTAAVFVVYLWAAKEIGVLYVHEPWQNDPYDAVVSFAFFFVPILALFCLIRAAMCKSAKPLPIRRAREMLIASRLMLAIAGVTLGAEWMSFALGVQRELWDSTTAVMLVALGFMTVVVLIAGLLVTGALRSTPTAENGPDWWSDASSVIDEYWRPDLPLGAALPRFAKWIIDHAAAVARGWPVATAAILAIGFGGLLAAFQGVAEEGFAPPVFILYMSVAAASMFAFLLAIGAHLHLAGVRQPMAVRYRRFSDSAATAAAVFAAALAFRQMLQPIVMFVPGRGIGHLMAGCLLVGVAVGIGVFAVESGLGVHQGTQIGGT